MVSAVEGDRRKKGRGRINLDPKNRKNVKVYGQKSFSSSPVCENVILGVSCLKVSLVLV